MLPLILPAEEWAGIEAAIAQRATLLNRVLVDVYGEQRLLAEGLLPPALVYGHSGFLRPCRGIKAARRRDAAHVRRRPRALARRPLVGGGRPHAGALGRGLRAGEPARHLAPVRRTCSATCKRAAPGRLLRHAARQPRALGARPTAPRRSPCWSRPGPHNETYFEHTYLARYLGIPLVEGSDLTVREDKVWLKTLSGLQRVHVILRRLDDDYCDPLELRSDSALGIAGLVEAVRRGNVLVANALGSNLLETGALLGFLPGLCERAARRAAEDALGRHLVVRRARGAARRGGASSTALVIKGAYSADARRADVRRGPRRARQEARHRDAAARARRCTWRRNWCSCRRRRSAIRAQPRQLLRARHRPARLRLRQPERLRGDARRPDARRDRHRCARDLDAARRLEQGHLGAVDRAGQHLQPAQARNAAAGPGAHRPQPVQPRGGEPVLVRPQHRALRRHRRACCAWRWCA